MNKEVTFICHVCNYFSSAIEGQSKNYCPVYSLDNSLVCRECSTPFNLGYEVAEVESTSDTLGNPDQTVCTGPLADGDESFPLENSKQQNSDDSRHKCKICPSTFKHKSNLTQHMRKHNGQNPFRCKQCKKDFDSKSKLKRHMRKHSNARPRKCRICHRTLGGKRDLIIHMNEHNGKNTFKCKLCDYTCENKNLLEIHLPKHSNERLNKCSICSKCYKYKSGLHKHMKIHDDPIPSKQRPCRKGCESKINNESLMAKQMH